MGRIHDLLAADHRRLEGLLERADRDADAYVAFRGGLLRHIGMEEKILLPAARRANGGQPLAEAARLRRDHGKLAALLVPSPRPDLLAEIRAILEPHDAIEEGPDGVYAACERLIGADEQAVYDALVAAPAVPLAPHFDGPRRGD